MGFMEGDGSELMRSRRGRRCDGERGGSDSMRSRRRWRCEGERDGWEMMRKASVPLRWVRAELYRVSESIGRQPSSKSSRRVMNKIKVRAVLPSSSLAFVKSSMDLTTISSILFSFWISSFSDSPTWTEAAQCLRPHSTAKISST
jgi:hypothetical protein